MLRVAAGGEFTGDGTGAADEHSAGAVHRDVSYSSGEFSF